MTGLIRRVGVVVCATTLLVAGGVARSGAQQVPGAPEVVGSWTDPFEEGGASTPRCVPNDKDTSGFTICKPTAVSSVMLPDGRIVYWMGIENQQNSRGPSAMSLSASARNSQARVLDLRSGTPQWITPTPERGDHANPDVQSGRGKRSKDLTCGMCSPGRPGDGFTGSTWGKIGGPAMEPDQPPDTANSDGDMFGADQTSLTDGRIIIAGGTDWYNEPRLMDRADGDPMDAGIVELEGLRSSSAFDYRTNTFKATSPMKFGRWYPQMVTQADGKVAIFSGASSMSNRTQAGQVRRTELFDPATNSWTEQYVNDKSETSLPMYPRMFLTPSGKSFYTGVGQMWGPFGQAADEALMMFQQLWDPASKTWSITGMGPLGGRSGTEVVSQLMNPPYDKLSMVTFGGTIGPPPGNWAAANAFTTVTTIGTDDKVDNKMVGNLHHARWFPSGVLLPDGQILAAAGADKDEVIDPGVEVPVHVDELFNPATGQWTETAAHARDRTYHNSAIVLPDMRVLLGGHSPIAAHYGGANSDQGGAFSNNDSDPSFEVWSPPYLFRGARPHITHAPAGIDYGEKFSIGTPQAAEIDSVVLLKTPSVTHTMDSDGRGLTLDFTKTGDGTLAAVNAPSGKVAPPGFYYLVVNKKSATGPIPSVARIVRVGGGSDSAEAIQPYPDDNAAPTGGSATAVNDSSNAGKAQQGAREMASAAPAPASAPAVAATQAASSAYTRLSAVRTSSSSPMPAPTLPMAAIGVASVVTLTGRRWIRRT
jgi:hypothetical protein